MIRTAEVSEDGRYRYSLARQWGPGPTVTFVMLNPSTADAMSDDPTIRRCISFAREWRCGRLVVVNLFAWRATNPRELKRAAGYYTPGGRGAQDIVGEHADRYIREALAGAWRVVAAWGATRLPWRYADRPRDIADLSPKTKWWCLGTTQEGNPRHPLYLRAGTPLERYKLGPTPEVDLFCVCGHGWREHVPSPEGIRDARANRGTFDARYLGKCEGVHQPNVMHHGRKIQYVRCQCEKFREPRPEDLTDKRPTYSQHETVVERVWRRPPLRVVDP